MRRARSDDRMTVSCIKPKTSASWRFADQGKTNRYIAKLVALGRRGKSQIAHSTVKSMGNFLPPEP